MAFQYCGGIHRERPLLCQHISTVDGGTHLTGFRTALTRTLNAYGKRRNIFKDCCHRAKTSARG